MNMRMDERPESDPTRDDCSLLRRLLPAVAIGMVLWASIAVVIMLVW